MNRCKQTAMLYNIRRATPRHADTVIHKLIERSYRGIRGICKALGISKKVPRVGARLNGARWGHRPVRKVVLRGNR
jgi:hypothetical protein